MTRYLDLTTALAERIASGELAPGTALPSLRDLAAQHGTTPTTVRRAYRELAEAGAVRLEARRTAKVAAGGALAARAMLRGAPAFRLAGSDDPALSLLTARVREAVLPVGGAGSYRGLAALWSSRADGAALHLRHRDGEYNTAFARAVLRGRDPVLVHLWHRDQGILTPGGNPREIRAITDLGALKVARRPRGTGTRSLLDRLLREAGLDPDVVGGPEVELHLDVAIAVASGEADAGLGLRSSATAFGLEFVPVAREPFQIATSSDLAGGLGPLLAALQEPELQAEISALGGYDMRGAGAVIGLA